MAKIVLINQYPQKADAITLLAGEVSGPIGIMQESGDPDLDGYIVKLPDDFHIAIGEIMGQVPRFNLPAKQMRAITVHGRRPGTTAIKIYVVAQKVTELGRIDVTVQDFNDPKDQDVDIFYLGQYVVWRRSLPPEGDTPGLLVFSASSGKNGVASAQKMRDIGPLPEGKYKLLAQFDPQQSTVDQANALLKEGDAPGRGPFQNTRPGIQLLPVGGAGPVNVQWGAMRVRLDPTFAVPGNRSGFYLHDSHKGYTSGCVEVRRDTGRHLFFDALLSYVSSGRAKKKPTLTVKVMYRDMDTTTHGNTIETE